MTIQDDTLPTLLAAIEADAARISRRLHDSASQNVAALLLGLKLLEKDVATSPTGKRTIASLTEISQDLGLELHRICDEVGPLALRDHGLSGALATISEQWAHTLNIPVRLEAEEFSGRYPLYIESIYFKIVRDVFNCISASKRRGHVRVSLTSTPERIVTMIEAEECSIEESNTTWAIALARAASVEGTVAIERPRENKIAITVCVPAIRR